MHEPTTAGTDPARTFTAVPPAARPRRVRRTARVLLIDEAERLLLLADSDPGVPGSSWWMTPGGGIEAGESERAAAVRELAEETGLRISQTDLVGPIAVRRAIHGYSDVIVEQDEIFFAVRVPAFEIDVAGRTDEERLTLTGHRWWQRGELAGTGDQIWPAAIGRIWAAVPPAADGSPGDPTSPVPSPGRPMDLGTQEESTVPSTG